jgi:hypothetical protein
VNQEGRVSGKSMITKLFEDTKTTLAELQRSAREKIGIHCSKLSPKDSFLIRLDYEKLTTPGRPLLQREGGKRKQYDGYWYAFVHHNVTWIQENAKKIVENDDRFQPEGKGISWKSANVKLKVGCKYFFRNA